MMTSHKPIGDLVSARIKGVTRKRRTLLMWLFCAGLSATIALIFFYEDKVAGMTGMDHFKQNAHIAVMHTLAVIALLGSLFELFLLDVEASKEPVEVWLLDELVRIERESPNSFNNDAIGVIAAKLKGCEAVTLADAVSIENYAISAMKGRGDSAPPPSASVSAFVGTFRPGSAPDPTR